MKRRRYSSLLLSSTTGDSLLFTRKNKSLVEKLSTISCGFQGTRSSNLRVNALGDCLTTEPNFEAADPPNTVRAARSLAVNLAIDEAKSV